MYQILQWSLQGLWCIKSYNGQYNLLQSGFDVSNLTMVSTCISLWCIKSYNGQYNLLQSGFDVSNLTMVSTCISLWCIKSYNGQYNLFQSGFDVSNLTKVSINKAMMRNTEIIKFFLCWELWQKGQNSKTFWYKWYFVILPFDHTISLQKAMAQSIFYFTFS